MIYQYRQRLGSVLREISSLAQVPFELKNPPDTFQEGFLVFLRCLPFDQLQALRVVFMTGPFGQAVVHVDNPKAVKNVAGWFE